MDAVAQLVLLSAGTAVAAIVGCLLHIARRDRRQAGGRTSVAWRIRTRGGLNEQPRPSATSGGPRPEAARVTA